MPTEAYPKGAKIGRDRLTNYRSVGSGIGW